MAFMMLIFIASMIALTSLPANAEDVIEVHTYSTDSNFQISTNYKTISVCECSTLTQRLTVSNPTSNPMTIAFSSEDGYVMFAEQSIHLDPSESRQVTAYINAPCDAPPQDTVVIKASSSLGKTQAFTQTVKFSNCQNLKAGVDERHVNASVCKPFSTTLFVKNTGSFRETYDVAVGEYDKHITLSDSRLTINPGVQKNVTVTYDLPCDVYGEHETSFTVSAKNNNRQAVVYQSLSIPKEYEFMLHLDRLSACQEDGTRSDYQFTLTNNNNFTDTFKISASTPRFTQDGLKRMDWLFPEEVTLGPGQQFTTNLTASGLQRISEDNYTVTFEVTSINGDTTKTLTRELEVSDCHDAELELTDTPDKFYVCAGDTFTKNARVKNSGSKRSLMEFTAAMPDFITFSNDSWFSKAGDVDDIAMHYSVPDNRNHKYPIDVTLYANADSADTESFKLFVDDKNTCFGISVKGSQQKVVFDDMSADLSLRNDGTRLSTYDLELLNATPGLELGNETVTVDTEGQAGLALEIDEDNALDDNMTSEDLIGKEFAGRLMITHVSSGYDQYIPVSLTVKDESIWKKAWSFIASLAVCTLIFFILSALTLASIVILLARVFSSKKEFKAQHQLLKWGVVFLLVAAIVITSVFGLPGKSTFYTQHNTTSDQLNKVYIVEDETLTLEYDEYFFDPDYNIATYGVDEVNESIMSFDINESEITLEPAADWHGNTSIELFVVDEYNETATSDKILVEVLPVEDHTVQSFFKAGCPYFNWLMLVILVLAIFFVFSMRTKRQPGRRPSRVARKRFGQKIFSRKTRARTYKSLMAGSIFARSTRKRVSPKANPSTSKKGSKSSVLKYSSGNTASKAKSALRSSRTRKKSVKKAPSKKRFVSSKKKTSSKKRPGRPKKTQSDQTFSGRKKVSEKKRSSKTRRGPGRPPKNK